MPKGIPLIGDRSVWDALVYKLLHANDIDASADAIHHTLGTGEFQAASGDHITTDLQGRDLSDALPEDGQGLVWDETSQMWLPGDVSAAGIAFVDVDVSSQIPAVDEHYDLVIPINGEVLILYKNGIRQEPGTYTIDGDGLGFTTTFSCIAGDTLVADYNGDVGGVPQYTVLFSWSGVLEVNTGVLRIYNPTNRIRRIKKVFASVNEPSSSSSVIIDIHRDGTTIFTNQANRPVIAVSAYIGSTTIIDDPYWEPDSYIQMHIDSAGNAQNLVVHVVYD